MFPIRNTFDTIKVIYTPNSNFISQEQLREPYRSKIDTAFKIDFIA